MNKKDFKELIKGLLGIWIVFILFFVPVSCLLKEYDTAIMMASIVTIMFGSMILTIIIGNKINLSLKKKNITKKSKEYERNFPKEYTVSVASLLLDNVFEEIVDIPAIILSLVGKNILIYEENNLKVESHVDISSLSNHEKYVYESIQKNQKIQPNKFRKYVIEDALRAKYIKEKKNTGRDPMNKAILISISSFIAIVFFGIYLSWLPQFLYYGIILMFTVSMIISPIIIFYKHDLDEENPYKNTRLGSEEVCKLLGLKKYLQDFSMLNEKEIKEAVIWEDYLAYAYMFGINKKIFEEFKGLKQIKNIVD